jgi:hypothetical protein
MPKTPRFEYLFHGKVNTNSVISCHSRSKDFLEIRESIKAMREVNFTFLTIEEISRIKTVKLVWPTAINKEAERNTSN